MNVLVHEHVPACDWRLCAVCSTCQRVHHGGGEQCLTCWGIDRLGWPESMRRRAS